MLVTSLPEAHIRAGKNVFHAQRAKKDRYMPNKGGSEAGYP
jgi:hypothetical protein